MTYREEQTIVFTDSGLGGLSIMADFYNTICNIPVELQQLNLVFFNALQAHNNGYNRMTSMQEKISTFQGALESIKKLYQPQKIAIACNTLSAIYPNTNFSKTNQNIFEIISSGKEIIQKHQKTNPETPLFIIATPTTIVSGVYNTKNKRTFSISGENLASLIELNSMMPELHKKIAEILTKIKQHLSENEAFSIFLGCTHYAYSTEIFKAIANELGLKLYSILDPADHFIIKLLHTLPKKNHDEFDTKINLQIGSQAEILVEEIKTISTLIKAKSPEIASLLKNYKRLPTTF